MTRRLVDVAQDVIVSEVDCGTLRGLECTALKKNEEIVETLAERTIGRTSLHNIVNPLTNELIVSSAEEITEEIAKNIEESPIEMVEIRSALTCETKRYLC